MNIWKSFGQGLRLTGRLWAAMLWFLAAVAFTTALNTALLPFQREGNQLVAAMPTDPAQRANVMLLSAGLFFFSVSIYLSLLGGTLAGMERALKNEAVGLGDVWRFSKERFGRMLLWGFGFAAWCIGCGLLVVIILAVISAAAHLNAEAMQTLAKWLFVIVMLLMGFPILYSAVPVARGQSGVWASFGQSRQFFKKHSAGTVLLVFLVSFVGAVIWWCGVLWSAVIVNRLRMMVGIPEYTTAFIPNLFLGFLLWWPPAVLGVLIPAVLYSYYEGNNA